MKLRDYISDNVHLIWPIGNHRKRSIQKLQEFMSFNDNGSRDLSDFSARDIKEYTNWLREEAINLRSNKRGLSKSTINKRLAAVSKVFNTAVDDKLISANGKPRIKAENVPTERGRHFTQREIALLKRYYADSDYPEMVDFLELCMNTGMRNSEMLSINKDEASADDKVAGKIIENGTAVRLENTKNGRGRTVPLNQKASRALKNLGYRPFDHYNHRHFYTSWQNARRKVAPGDTSFVFYCARHSFASYLANEKNISIKIIADLMGHTDISTTARYIHTKPSQAFAIVNALEL